MTVTLDDRDRIEWACKDVAYSVQRLDQIAFESCHSRGNAVMLVDLVGKQREELQRIEAEWRQKAGL